MPERASFFMEPIVGMYLINQILRNCRIIEYI